MATNYKEMNENMDAFKLSPSQTPFYWGPKSFHKSISQVFSSHSSKTATPPLPLPPPPPSTNPTSYFPIQQHNQQHIQYSSRSAFQLASHACGIYPGHVPEELIGHPLNESSRYGSMNDTKRANHVAEESNPSGFMQLDEQNILNGLIHNFRADSVPRFRPDVDSDLKQSWNCQTDDFLAKDSAEKSFGLNGGNSGNGGVGGGSDGVYSSIWSLGSSSSPSPS
ncbi:hypothetical protein AYI68_g1957, partial [Smittium mucronatum]